MDSTIGNLPAASTPLSGSEHIEVEQGGNSRRIPSSLLSPFSQSKDGALQFAYSQYTNDADGLDLLLLKGRGTQSSAAAVQVGDEIFSLSSRGVDVGLAAQTGGKFYSKVVGVDAGRISADYRFAIADALTGILTDKFILGNDGMKVIGGDGPVTAGLINLKLGNGYNYNNPYIRFERLNYTVASFFMDGFHSLCLETVYNSGGLASKNIDFLVPTTKAFRVGYEVANASQPFMIYGSGAIKSNVANSTDYIASFTNTSTGAPGTYPVRNGIYLNLAGTAGRQSMSIPFKIDYEGMQYLKLDGDGALTVVQDITSGRNLAAIRGYLTNTAGTIVTLTVAGAAGTAHLQDWNRAAGSTLSFIDNDGSICVSGAGANSQRFGLLSTADGANGLAVGYSVNATGARSIVLGNTSTASGADAIIIGYNSTGNANANKLVIGNNITMTGATGGIAIGNNITGTLENNVTIGLGNSNVAGGVCIGNGSTNANATGVCVGTGATLGGNSYIAIGGGVTSSGNYSIGIGKNMTVAHRAVCFNANSTANGQIVFGGSNDEYFFYTDLYLGGGVVSAFTAAGARDFTINATGGSGTDKTGAKLALAGGKGTGTGVGGAIEFWTANAGTTGTTLQTLTKKGSFNVDGTFTIGAYTLPKVDGSANQILKTNGSGVVAWATDTAGIVSYVAVPAGPTATGTQGQRAYASNYVYECVATDTWVRYAAESTWS